MKRDPEKINGYLLSRKFFDWAFENPNDNNPTLTALYFFIVEVNNRLGWKSEFSITSKECQEAIGISSYNTYKKNFDKLCDLGFIKIAKKAKNQYQCNIIALSNFDKAHYKALDTALIKHSENTCDILKQRNNKQKNYDIVDENSFLKEFERFRKCYPGTKRALNTEFDNFKKRHKDYQEAVFLLHPAVEKLIEWRKQNQKANQFTPPFANMQTWINQRRWEDELSTLENNHNEESKTKRRKASDIIQ